MISKRIKDNDLIVTKADKANSINLMTRKYYSYKINFHTKEVIELKKMLPKNSTENPISC